MKVLAIMQQKCPGALDKILNQEIESIEVTLSSQVAILSSADYLCKQFLPRSGRTNCLTLRWCSWKICLHI